MQFWKPSQSANRDKIAVRLKIATKIWLTIGIFSVGFIFSALLESWQDRKDAELLQNASETLFPAAIQSQEAEAAFERAVKGFSDAVVMQDLAGLRRAAADGTRATENLRLAASIPGQRKEDADAAGVLAVSVANFLADALTAYSAVAGHPEKMTRQTQERMRDLASRTGQLKAELHQFATG